MRASPAATLAAGSSKRPMLVPEVAGDDRDCDPRGVCECIRMPGPAEARQDKAGQQQAHRQGLQEREQIYGNEPRDLQVQTRRRLPEYEAPVEKECGRHT